MDKKNCELTPDLVEIINKILQKGDRVEVCPGKDGVTLLQVRRIKTRLN